ncbi:GNAT family N-acetyltransferase [Paragemmobacter straminiformis]|uniref:GNAT family N-acetyltransferase n=1 Tax=Paragemmobacter straminiformis TaxID=2045119 RepID=A0A842I461_9RHOB|nr:GNAT family N-acetyltransferase [Gemmobacter straminiformis]MBC2834932.1 GNAT family N-acetyltransferase [Gemmobacter straminiformis]
MHTIRLATDLADFRTIHRMRAEMAAWDEAECRKLGYPADGVAAAYYSDTVEDLQRIFTAQDAAMLVVEQGAAICGHAGFSRYDAGQAEVLLVWLDPMARGGGLAKALLADLCTAVQGKGYKGAVLETAPFMADAIRLYQRFGFSVCAPFRDAPPDLAPITIFMRASF